MAQQVSAAVEEIAAGIDEQAQAMDEVARRAEYLSTAGDNIHELVDLFKLDADDSAAVDDIAETQVETGQSPETVVHRPTPESADTNRGGSDTR
jgi:methyl-accepting chemotaxis protein